MAANGWDRMYQRYKQLENWAKVLLHHATMKHNDVSGTRGVLKALIQQTLITADLAQRFRRDIQNFYPNDSGYKDEIAWVNEHVIIPAQRLGDATGLQYHPLGSVCRPSGIPHQHQIRRDTSVLFPSNSCEPTRACFLHPMRHQRVFFMVDIGCVEVKFTPGQVNDIVVSGPMLNIEQWSCLQGAAFFLVDAILPNPLDINEAYFFSADRFVLVDIVRDKIVKAPANITNEWPSLWQAGFTTVDAVVPNPTNNSQAYFFRGEQYVLVDINPGTYDTKIVEGPEFIENGWPSLEGAGFDTIDAILLNPSTLNTASATGAEAYLFSGDRYARIRIKTETNRDEIVDGPHAIAEKWPSLKEALFY